VILARPFPAEASSASSARFRRRSFSRRCPVALTSLLEISRVRPRICRQGQARLPRPAFNTEQAFKHYDDALEHSVWLTMMRDRLEEVEKLVAEEGSVWVHCDDSEQAYI
jgi:adenine-specific DNA-methyltransferase